MMLNGIPKGTVGKPENEKNEFQFWSLNRKLGLPSVPLCVEEKVLSTPFFGQIFLSPWKSRFDTFFEAWNFPNDTFMEVANIPTMCLANTLPHYCGLYKFDPPPRISDFHTYHGIHGDLQVGANVAWVLFYIHVAPSTCFSCSLVLICLNKW